MVPGARLAPRDTQPTIGPLQVPPCRLSPLWTPMLLPPPPPDFPKFGPHGTLARVGLPEPLGVPPSPPGGGPVVLQRRRDSRPPAGVRQVDTGSKPGVSHGSPFQTPGALLQQGRSSQACPQGPRAPEPRSARPWLQPAWKGQWIRSRLRFAETPPASHRASSEAVSQPGGHAHEPSLTHVDEHTQAHTPAPSHA